MRFADPHFRIQRAVFPGLLVVAVAIAFSNSLRVPFLLDDFPTIPGNASITRLSAITSVLFPPPEVYSAGRPVLNLSFALNHAIGGTAAGGYHVVNVVIHMVAALLLFGIARRGLELPAFARRFTNTAFAIAFLIAALWALHPLQTVSVTYV